MPSERVASGPRIRFRSRKELSGNSRWRLCRYALRALHASIPDQTSEEHLLAARAASSLHDSVGAGPAGAAAAGSECSWKGRAWAAAATSD